jgi:hypothetical protein
MSTTRGLSLAVLVALPALAQAAPSLVLPVACELGKTCIVQNYVDREASAAARDYRCGFLTYDGHKGTDIRVMDLALYKSGVPVLAAAAGRVRAVRDSMQDLSVRLADKAALAGREAGNSVVVDHGDGWETQYAHLRKGSVAVRAGERVDAGQRLGVVGLSGNTEFPHLHFEVRHGGKSLDPFVGLAGAKDCEAGERPLWQSQALRDLAYTSTGVLGAGISGAPPALADGSIDLDKSEPLAASAAAAIFWVHIYGARANDIEQFSLVGPDGRVLAERRGRIERNRARWLAYVGKRKSQAPWASGAYRATYALYREPQANPVLLLTRVMRVE